MSGAAEATGAGSGAGKVSVFAGPDADGAGSDSKTTFKSPDPPLATNAMEMMMECITKPSPSFMLSHYLLAARCPFSPTDGP